MSRRLIIGCGNLHCGDDAAGILVIRSLRRLGREAVEHSGDGLSMLDLWLDAEEVVLVDAIRSGRPPGTVIEWDAAVSTDELTITSCLLGVGEAIELGRILGRLPPSLKLYGIEAACVDQGADPSPAVLDGVAEVVRRITSQAAASGI